MTNATRGRIVIAVLLSPAQGIPWFEKVWNWGTPKRRAAQGLHLLLGPSECNPYSDLDDIRQNVILRTRDEELCLYDGSSPRTRAPFSRTRAGVLLPFTQDGRSIGARNPSITSIHRGIDFGKHDDFSVVSVFRLDTSAKCASCGFRATTWRRCP